MASERLGVTLIVQNESPLTYHFYCATHSLNLSASAAVKVSAIQNAKNVVQKKMVKMFKTSAKETALLKSCIKKDVSSQVRRNKMLSCRLT